MNDNLQTLIERRDWLQARIKAKQSVHWETLYDVREHRALCWAVGELSGEKGGTIEATRDSTDEKIIVYLPTP